MSGKGRLRPGSKLTSDGLAVPGAECNVSATAPSPLSGCGVRGRPFGAKEAGWEKRGRGPAFIPIHGRVGDSRPVGLWWPGGPGLRVRVGQGAGSRPVKSCLPHCNGANRGLSVDLGLLREECSPECPLYGPLGPTIPLSSTPRARFMAPRAHSAPADSFPHGRSTGRPGQPQPTPGDPGQPRATRLIRRLHPPHRLTRTGTSTPIAHPSAPPRLPPHPAPWAPRPGHGAG